MGAEIEDRSGTSAPPVTLGCSVEELVEATGLGLDDQDVPIASAADATLDWRVVRDGIGAGIALVGIVKLDRDAGLRLRHRDEGNSDRSSLIQPRAKIRVQSGVCSDRGDIGI